MDRFGSEVDPDLTAASSARGKTYKCKQVRQLNFESLLKALMSDDSMSNITKSLAKRCEHQYYNVIATSSAYPNYNVHPYRTDYCLIIIKIHRWAKS